MSERLEIIKFLRESEKTVAPGMQPSELISRKDVDWLIQQAERVQELEKQNKRYREALEEIRDRGTYELNNAMKTDYAWIADEALNGDNNE